jgi:hypothetical protein
MRTLMRIVLALALLLLVTPTCFGQKSRGSKRGAAKPRPRPTPEKEDEFPSATIELPSDVSLSAGTPDEVREVGAASINYYRRRGKTGVYVGGEVYRKAPIWIRLSCSFEVKGKEVVRPEVVEVIAFSNFAVFDEGVGLVIEADGKRFDFKPRPESCFKRKCINLSAHVDFATFEQLARSRSVTVRAAPYTFNLSAAAREALGDMLRAIESPPKDN